VKMDIDTDVQNAFTRVIPGRFSRTMTPSSRWMIGVHTPMRSLLVRCTTSLAALTFASFGIHFLYADDGPEISQRAMNLNQRGLSHLRKKEYDQAIASFREALQIQREYSDALMKRIAGVPAILPTISRCAGMTSVNCNHSLPFWVSPHLVARRVMCSPRTRPSIAR
jgi:hypothetical protein